MSLEILHFTTFVMHVTLTFCSFFHFVFFPQFLFFWLHIVEADAKIPDMNALLISDEVFPWGRIKD